MRPERIWLPGCVPACWSIAFAELLEKEPGRGGNDLYAEPGPSASDCPPGCDRPAWQLPKPAKKQPAVTSWKLTVLDHVADREPDLACLPLAVVAGAVPGEPGDGVFEGGPRVIAGRLVLAVGEAAGSLPAADERARGCVLGIGGCSPDRQGRKCEQPAAGTRVAVPCGRPAPRWAWNG